MLSKLGSSYSCRSLPVQNQAQLISERELRGVAMAGRGKPAF